MGKVDTERMLNAAAAASGGRWDAVTLCPGRICGPVLFRAQYGQWPALIGDLCEGRAVEDTHWNMLDVRDLAVAQRLAAESAVDHGATAGGSRYQMVTTGTGRIVALYCRSSTTYQVCYGIRCLDF
jgi:hypothetical protein